MAKWNPFEKQILNADPDEFAGSEDAGYGVPRDADIKPQKKDTTTPDESAGFGGFSSVNETEENSFGQDTSYIQGGSFEQTLSNEPGDCSGQDASVSFSGQDTPGMPDGSYGQTPVNEHEASCGQTPLNEQETSCGQIPPERQEASYGQTPLNEHEISCAQTPLNEQEASCGQATSGMPGASFGQDASDRPEDFFQQAPAYQTPSGPEPSGQASSDPSSSGPAPVSPGHPAGPSGPGFGSKHDFEDDDDEPKFDTQTGERLDKPKRKFPAMLLSAVVAVLAVSAFVYAVMPGAIPSRIETVEKEPVETQTPSASVLPESETKASQTEKEPLPGTVVTAEAPENETEILTQDKQAGVLKTEASSENGEDVQAADTKGGLTLTGQSAAGSAGTRNSEETETETETEAEKSIIDRIPSFTEDGVTVSTSLDVSDMVEEVMPGIVSVTCTSVQTVLDFFYGAQEIRQVDAGSGIIVGKDDEYLYIVTDAGIVKGAQDITVGFSVKEDLTKDLTDDDTISKAEIMDIDEENMLAVIRVPLDGIHETVRSLIRPSVLGDSDAIRVGERAIAIGNAMGRGLSVTQGIISAVNRSMRYGDYVHDFIQTDASINYGNYGGALLNEEGKVIGINAGKITDTASEGMGYAIPVNDAKVVISRILPSAGKGSSGGKEKTEEPETGNAASSGTKKEKEQKETLALALAEEESETSSVKEESAQTEKIRETMPQTEENGQESSRTEGNRNESSQTEEISKESSQTEGISKDLSKPGENDQAKSQGQLGIQVGEFSKEDQIIYRIPAGVVVAQVTDGSGAQAAGLSSGDLIIRINDKDVSSVVQLKDALEGLKVGDKVLVTFLRPDEEGGYKKEEELAVMVTLQ